MCLNVFVDRQSCCLGGGNCFFCWVVAAGLCWRGKKRSRRCFDAVRDETLNTRYIAHRAATRINTSGMPAETVALGNGPWMHLRKNPSRSYYPRTADPLSSTRDCNVCEFGSGVTPQLIQAARHGDK